MYREKVSSRFTCIALAVLSAAVAAPNAQAQVLLSDDFNTGTQANPLEWRVPFGGDSSFLGQTQLKTDNALLPSIVGGAAQFELDTFFDEGGTVFSGHEMITKRNFALGGGLVWKARMKLGAGTPNGVVGGGFLFDVTREIPVGTSVRDEIDVELLSNEANGDNRVLTNVWDDENFIDGAGASEFVPGSVPPASPYDLNAYHDYEIRWTPGQVQYSIDDTVVRTYTGDEVPNDPMSARFNIWVPDSGFSEAYDAGLTPATSAGAGSTYTMEVDSVSIERINTTTSADLLTNGSFETASTPGLDWTQFNNAADETDNEAVPAQDGTTTMKTFGPFTGGSDASGAFQTVTNIDPGKEYSASVFAWSDSVDTIAGQNNFAEIVLAFQDSAGNTIEEKKTPIYDGRDALITTAGVQDAWNEFTVEGLAPAGTEQAVVSLFFIQIVDDNGGPDGGAIWFDNASLVELIAESPMLEGDYDDSGQVGQGDLDLVLLNWGADTPPVPEGWVNQLPSGQIGQAELDGVLLNWGAFAQIPAGATAAVPEPTCALLLVGGLIGLGACRRRTS